MTTFTASEVRELAKHMESVGWRPDSKGDPECYDEGVARSAEILFAFADLLEAREKAEPVYQHRSKSGPMFRWFDCSEEIFMAMEHNEHDRKHFDRRILYTHPAPSDAERLAEALQPFANLFQALYATMPDDRPIYGINKAEITAGDLRRANEALAAHSAHSDAERLEGALREFAVRCLSNAMQLCSCVHTQSEQSMAQVWQSCGEECEELLAAHSAQAQLPADAERLAEALRELAGKWEQRDYNASRARNAAGHDHAMELRQALAAHSAQAQKGVE